MNRFRFSIAAIAVGIITSHTWMMMSNAHGQEPEATIQEASAEIKIESIDVDVEINRLKVLLRPLTAAELETEAGRWLALLRQKIQEVGQLELELQALTESESAGSLSQNLVKQRTEQTAIVERTQTVLDNLKAKGGDVKAMEQYIAAISDISETTDSVSYWAAIRGELRNWA